LCYEKSCQENKVSGICTAKKFQGKTLQRPPTAFGGRRRRTLHHHAPHAVRAELEADDGVRTGDANLGRPVSSEAV